MRKVLLDTNAYSAYRKGDDRVLEALSEADRVFVSVFVLGELFYGFKAGDREPRNRRELRDFLRNPTVRTLHTTDETADIFATLKDRLRRKGTPIPINDVWIASHCFETGSILVTFDEHFSAIDGLRIRTYEDR